MVKGQQMNITVKQVKVHNLKTFSNMFGTVNILPAYFWFLVRCFLSILCKVYLEIIFDVGENMRKQKCMLSTS